MNCSCLCVWNGIGGQVFLNWVFIREPFGNKSHMVSSVTSSKVYRIYISEMSMNENVIRAPQWFAVLDVILSTFSLNRTHSDTAICVAIHGNTKNSLTEVSVCSFLLVLFGHCVLFVSPVPMIGPKMIWQCMNFVKFLGMFRHKWI